ncbi:MAG: hypothetical protein IPH62_19935 [Ignavibacteriae bacterium]|nr:hypothetical protein [Ignavibacteriota bacterium]
MENNLSDHALEYLKCRQNPFYFIYNYVEIPEIGGSLKLADNILHSKMKRVVRCTIKYNRVILMASRQLGKALSVTTPIPMANGGYKLMGNLEVGDMIFDENGNPTEIIATTEIMYERPCYRINFDNFESIIADENHLWNISNTSLKFENEIKTTKEIYELEEKISKYKKPTSCRISLPESVNYNNKKELLLDPYLLGLWLGDGAKDVNVISCLETDYIEYCELLENEGYELSGFNFTKNSNNISGRFTIYGILPILREMKLLGNKHIPKNYLCSSLNNRLNLLRGLMDSDGYCMPGGTCQFSQKDFKLLTQVRQLLNSLGLKSKLSNKIIKNQKYYTLTFTTEKYYVFNLQRKKIRQDKDNYKNECLNVYIKSIVKVESVPVRCIQVSNSSGMFLCGESMIPTHNSTIAGALLLWATNFYAGLPAVILNMRQVAALENLNRIKFMHSKLPDWLRSPVKGRAERKTYFELQNGSIVRTFYPSSSTPADQLARSLTAPILYIDECAFINHIGLAYRSAQPILSKAREQAIKNGYPYFILLTSTPNGIYGNGKFFYDYWENAIDSDEIFDENENIVANVDDFLNIKEKNKFIRVKYHWSEDPTKDEQWYDIQKQELNHDIRGINQELDLLFIGSTTCIFTDEFLSNLKPKKPIELVNLRHASNLKIYSELNDKDFYLIGIDSAKSLTGDFCSIEIFSYKNFIQVGEFFGKLGSLTKFTDIIFDVLTYLGIRVNHRILLCIENNSVGAAVIENIENEGTYSSYIYSDKADKFITGLNTNTKTKDFMISLFYDYINNNPGHIKSADLIGQLSVIEKKSNGSISSKNGYHDDLFMASCFCAYVKKQTILEIEHLIEFDQEIIDKEDEYLITNVAYNNKPENSNKFSLFPNAESYLYINDHLQEEKDDMSDYEDGSDLIDFISL